MHIQQEAPDRHGIRSYSPTSVVINDKTYEQSVIVSHDTIIPSWPVRSIADITEAHLSSLLNLKPDVIIIGHNEAALLPLPIMQYLSKKRIGVECMSIGAACRTFNVLLGEQRDVMGIILFK